MDENYLELNKETWDRRAEKHFDSAFYDVDGFLQGKTTLQEIELQELGEISGQSLLHLQCHFGLDTLSLARMGARCTGVDLSPVAIAKANALRDETGLAAQFVCSDIYSFKRAEPAPFDRVFTSYGTICWLPDIRRWAQVIADNLRTDGEFYMAEFHPIYDLLAGYSYFHRPEPDIEEAGSYTENSAALKTRMANWSHPLGTVLNALIAAGLHIQQVNEYPFSPYNCFPELQETTPGRFVLRHADQEAPLVYTIKAIKVA